MVSEITLRQQNGFKEVYERTHRERERGRSKVFQITAGDQKLMLQGPMFQVISFVTEKLLVSDFSYICLMASVQWFSQSPPSVLVVGKHKFIIT